MKLYKGNDMQVEERYGKVENTDMIMNECVAYCVVKK